MQLDFQQLNVKAPDGDLDGNLGYLALDIFSTVQTSQKRKSNTVHKFKHEKKGELDVV